MRRARRGDQLSGSGGGALASEMETRENRRKKKTKRDARYEVRSD